MIDTGKALPALLLVLSSYATLYAQEAYDPIKWVVSPSVGVTLGSNGLFQGNITDHLIGYDNRTVYGNFISAAYFFTNWGAEFCLSGNFGTTSDVRHKHFESAVSNAYSANYYVQDMSEGLNDGFGSIGMPMGTLGIGPVYKWERKRIVLMGRALVGIASFERDVASVGLKGKGTNELLQINWNTGKQGFFTFSPSLTVGYRISKLIVLDLDVRYARYKVDFTYTEKTEDMNSGQITKVDYRYHSQINQVSLGIGAMIIIGSKHNR